MMKFLDHAVRSARAAREPAERRSPLRTAEPAARTRTLDPDDTQGSAASAAQITGDDSAARQSGGDEFTQASGRRPIEASSVRAARAARPSPAHERAPEPAEASQAAPRRTAAPLEVPRAPASPSAARTGEPPARSGHPAPSARRGQTELLAGAWITAGSATPAQQPPTASGATTSAGAHTPGPPSRTAPRATAESARSIALAAATITDADPRPATRGPQQPSAVASPGSLPTLPGAQSAPAALATRIAAPQPATPPAQGLHIEHLDVRVIQEPAPRAAARPPSPASHATPRGAWRPSARRFLKQP